jgi:hypothetical protein
MEKDVMTALKPYRAHLSRKEDLVTTHEQNRAGFLSLALERNRRSSPFVEQARALKVRAHQAHSPSDLTGMPDILPAVLTAAGVSDKSASHLQPDDAARAIDDLITKYLEPAGSAFVEELVYRFLLTRGDSLGGAMRNVAGVLARRRLAAAIAASLTIGGVPFYWLDSNTSMWVPGPDASGAELAVKGVSWQARGKRRTLLLDKKVSVVEKNVDICLLAVAHSELTSGTNDRPSAFVALGELKGGIDPAGADEHWKTATKTLSRIRMAFARYGPVPPTFFVGAAIAVYMAQEIWAELEDGTLHNAANLNDLNQVSSLCRWLVTI